eukprot:352499-Chlamydomonas_euryale.AAC.5
MANRTDKEAGTIHGTNPQVHTRQRRRARLGPSCGGTPTSGRKEGWGPARPRRRPPMQGCARARASGGRGMLRAASCGGGSHRRSLRRAPAAAPLVRRAGPVGERAEPAGRGRGGYSLHAPHF